MKTKLKYILPFGSAGLTLSLSSCSDFMDLTPEDQYDEATVWSDADLAKTDCQRCLFVRMRHSTRSKSRRLDR